MSTTAMQKAMSDRINRIEPSITLTVVAEAAKLRAQGVDLADLGAGEPHFATPQHIKQAAIDAINADFTRYTAVAGIPELRRAIVERHARDFGSDYSMDECMATAGGKHALFNAFQVLVDHGDEVIIPVPYWVSFKDMIEYCGGRCVYVETDEVNGFRLTAEMVERALTSRTRMIILNTPNNPSGAVMSREDQEAIAQLAHERGIYVVADECYVYLNYSGSVYSLGAFRSAKQHLVIIGSLSKTYAMTGWRMGYALAPASVTAAMQKLQSQSTSNPSSVVQKAAIAALNGPQDAVEEMKRDYVSLRERALAGISTIPQVTCVRPDGAFYVYPNVSAYFGRGGVQNSAELAKRLLHEAHVVTVPGEGFGTRDHIRLSYATSATEVDKAIRRMREWFAALA